MTRMTLAATAIALALGAGAASADSQLIASTGLTPQQAEGMTLTEIAQYKFNRDALYADRWNPSIAPAQGSGFSDQLAATSGIQPERAAAMSLTEVAAVKFNNDSRPDDAQVVARPSRPTVVVATRSGPGSNPAHGQLVAGAGLTQAEAQGMSLTEIAQHKFDRDGANAD
jgi:hypothetical protein